MTASSIALVALSIIVRTPAQACLIFPRNDWPPGRLFPAAVAYLSEVNTPFELFYVEGVVSGTSTVTDVIFYLFFDSHSERDSVNNRCSSRTVLPLP